jgi:hypothetical protein
MNSEYMKKLFGKTKFEKMVEELIHIGYTTEMIHPGRFFSTSNRIALDHNIPLENSTTYEKHPRVVAIGSELHRRGGTELMLKAALQIQEVLGVTAIQELRWVWSSNVENRMQKPDKTKRMIDNGDGTLTDNKIKLMWQKEDDGQKRTFKEGEEYCKKLTLGGYKDWRLPTIDELRSINNVMGEIFTNTKNDEPYWSNSLISNPEWEPDSGEKAKYIVKVLFSDGTENNYFPHYKYYSRAVRDEQQFDENKSQTKDYTNKIKKCLNCNMEIPDDKLRCPNCGSNHFIWE